ncbi:MAG: PTS lactose/cellobiose transporter subunit IIA [Erysipelotrichaceae bacterium]|nr:PTS lactose/cellobiose transporter subunit IIA [Erysipelotrichaceae bacterium]
MMDEMETVIINLIVNSGSARSSAIEAIQFAKAGDMEKARESLEQAKESVNEGHHSQTELIQAEIRGEKAPLSLLMVHAQDHLMTSLLCIDLATEFVDLYEKVNG